MFNFLHTHIPNPILISFGPINIYWYGIFIVSGILLAVLITLKLAEKHNLPKNTIIDAVFYLLLSGIIGARLYHILLEWPFYLAHPINALKLWQGGLAIHGAIIAGLLMLWQFSKKYKIKFFMLTALFVPGLALAQAIGRWGNYFNQELFGKPTNLPWGIPILPTNRINEYFNSQFFHPAFLYESLANLLIFFILIITHILIIKKRTARYELCVISYLIMYSLLRFSMEFIRIDATPIILGLRFPQLISLIIIFLSIAYLLKTKKHANFK